jgi:hypothetical protein
MQDIAVVERFLTSLHVSSFLGPGRPMSGGRGHRCAGQSIVREELSILVCPPLYLSPLLAALSFSFILCYGEAFAAGCGVFIPSFLAPFIRF